MRYTARRHWPAWVRLVGWLSALLLVNGCATTPDTPPAPTSTAATPLAVPWVRNAVEYQAAALQTYQQAAWLLESLLADRSWSALPNQTDAAGKPAAIILDVDETVLDNALYQEREGGRYDPATWDTWIAARGAVAVPGVVEFLARARALGIATFFVTNRPCRQRPGSRAACPQEQDTLDNLRDLGIATDSQRLMLLQERPEWGREKQSRRDLIARDYRVIMLFGDQLGDFVACARSSIEAPCTVAATAGSRRALFLQHQAYWGRGWYMLPNPMYGSWTGF